MPPSLPPPCATQGYVFESHRHSRYADELGNFNGKGRNVASKAAAALAAATELRDGVLDGRTAIERLSELERKAEPEVLERAGVWGSRYAVVSCGFWAVCSSFGYSICS